jgi:hypothetical protein
MKMKKRGQKEQLRVRALRKKIVRIDNDLKAISMEADDGDFPSLIYLTAIGSQVTANLYAAARKHPEKIKKFVRGFSMFPVPGHRGASAMQDLNRFYDTIGLNSDLGYIHTDQLLKNENPFKNVVYFALNHIRSDIHSLREAFSKQNQKRKRRRKISFSQFCDDFAKEHMEYLLQNPSPYREKEFNAGKLADYYKGIAHLPPLKRESLPVWDKLVRAFVLLHYRGVPESDDALKPAGKSKLNKTTGTKEANMKDGIMQRISQAFTKLIVGRRSSYGLVAKNNDGKVQPGSPRQTDLKIIKPIKNKFAGFLGEGVCLTEGLARPPPNLQTINVDAAALCGFMMFAWSMKKMQFAAAPSAAKRLVNHTSNTLWIHYLIHPTFLLLPDPYPSPLR